MQSLDFAIQMEKDGEIFYRMLSNNCEQGSGMSYILNMLADDESKHRRVFMSIQQSNPGTMASTTVLTEADNIFAKMRKENVEIDCGQDQLNLYNQALEMEENSIDLYVKALADMENEDEKALIRKIIAEEEKHRRILENIIEHVSRPNQWVEDAEFHHKEEY